MAHPLYSRQGLPLCVLVPTLFLLALGLAGSVATSEAPQCGQYARPPGSLGTSASAQQACLELSTRLQANAPLHVAFHPITSDVELTYIDDGGGDAYDDGNEISSPGWTGDLLYTGPGCSEGVQNGQRYYMDGFTVGSGGEARWWPTVFTNFQGASIGIEGNNGADGDGYVEIGSYFYKGWRAFWKQLYDTGDTGIVHVWATDSPTAMFDPGQINANTLCGIDEDDDTPCTVDTCLPYTFGSGACATSGENLDGCTAGSDDCVGTNVAGATVGTNDDSDGLINVQGFVVVYILGLPVSDGAGVPTANLQKAIEETVDTLEPYGKECTVARRLMKRSHGSHVPGHSRNSRGNQNRRRRRLGCQATGQC